MTDIFSPPTDPADGEGYTFGNLIWEYEADNGVWNIKDGSLVGAQGTMGAQGANGFGSQGTVGAQGSVGSQGTDGSVGEGSQGIQGVQGTQGVLGAQGTQGRQGVLGSQGTQGTQGVLGAQGTQGTQGVLGAQGTQGTQGVQGPAGGGLDGGSPNQILYKNSSNAVAGDADFLFDGASATFGGGTFAFDADTYVLNGIFKYPKEIGTYNTSSSSLLEISPENGTIQRYDYSPPSVFTVGAASSGWSSITGTVETLMVLLRMGTGVSGFFSNNIYAERGSREAIIGGKTGSIEMVTIMRVALGSSNGVAFGFQVASGMTGSSLAGLQ